MPETKTSGNPQPDQPQGEVLDLTAAAEFLKVSKPTFYRWLAQEKIKGFKAGTQWRFYRKDLEEFLETDESQVAQEVEGFTEAVDAARAESGLPAVDWKQAAADEMPRVTWFVRTLFADAIAARASDIHLDVDRDGMQIRFRVDGVLNEVMSLPKHLHAPLLSQLKLMADLNLVERRMPQDGRIRMRLEERDFDFRVTTMPSVFGEGFVCRILDQSSVMLGLNRLGMSDQVRETLERKVREPWGLVVFSGPSGCGKTTTAYSAFHLIQAPQLKLISIEDPVEYQLRGTTQVHVNRKAGLTWPVALRFFTRYDPDVVFVGRTEDLASAEQMMNAAMTGHLVLTTMLPTDAPSVITRFLEMGVEPFLIASALTAVVAQRLVRKVCPECRQEDHPSKEALRRLGLTNPEIKAATFARGAGCLACRQTGFKGRTGVYELLEMDERLRELTARRAATGELREAAIEGGMVPLMHEGLRLVREGVTTLEEVMRVLSVHDV